MRARAVGAPPPAEARRDIGGGPPIADFLHASVTGLVQVFAWPTSGLMLIGMALGAAMMSSLIGAVFGALVLGMAIPVVRPLVLTLGSPEFFMLARASHA